MEGHGLETDICLSVSIAMFLSFRSIALLLFSMFVFGYDVVFIAVEVVVEGKILSFHQMNGFLFSGISEFPL